VLAAVRERFSLMSVVQPSDPDLRDTIRSVARLPTSWWAKLDEMEREVPSERLYLVIQLVRHSQAQPGTPPLPEGPEFLKMEQSTVKFTEERWGMIDAEAKRRGLSRNRVLQAHLARGFKAYDADRAAESKPKK
jgi:hypothetical protein